LEQFAETVKRPAQKMAGHLRTSIEGTSLDGTHERRRYRRWRDRRL
jgi:hypothetical protein